MGVSGIFVGRGAELEVLRSAVAGAEAESPSAVLIGGESGIGKSRLMRELAAEFPAQVLIGACVELGGDGLPFAPFTAALRGRFPVLAPEGEAGVARVRLFERVLELLDGLAADRPMVLVIEDAHWADRSSRDLLDFLVRNQPARLVIVATYRSDDVTRAHPLRPLVAELSRLPWVRRLELARLSRREVVEQVRAIRGREPEPELVEVIYRRSEGNPLFVETLLDSGASARLPASLGDLLLDRIDRLPERAGRVVRTAAVGGEFVGHSLLVAVTGLDDAALSEAVRPAVAANVLTVSGDGYAFRHALIREAAYGSLLPGERGPLHRRYAEALVDGPATELARHRIAAGDVAAAVPAAYRAAEVCRAGGAYAEQLEMLEQVLRLWFPDALTGARRVDVVEQAVEAAHGAGDHVRGQELATEALALVDPAVEPVRAAWLLERRGRMRRHTGHPGDLDDLRAAVDVVPAGDPARAVMLTALATRYLDAPHPSSARAAALEALEIATRHGDERSAAAATVTLATLQARRGDLEAQLKRLVAAREQADRLGAHSVAMKALQCESGLLLGFGQAARAAEVARSALGRVRAMGVARAYGAVHAIDLVGALLGLGRWDEGLDVIEHALELAPPAAFRAHLLCIRGLICLYRGDLAVPEEAVGLAHELLAGGAGFAQDPLRLPRLEIELRLAQGRVDEAVAVLERALALPYLPDTPRFAWMLMSVGASVASGPVRGLLAEVAGRLGVFTPVQRADSAMFLARMSAASGELDRQAWEAAVAAWESLGRPYSLAEALLPAGEAALRAGDREAAGDRLRRAFSLCSQLGAVPLRGRVEDLARRARISLGDKGIVAEAGPGRELGLTPREMEILRLVTQGRGNREIAAELFISAKTASVHVSNVIAKLGVTNRVEAAAAAHRLGLV